jgi:homogentisate 1,2-dioxygenase
MAIYQRQGIIPRKRHVVFRQDSGRLFHEELFGTEGFSGHSSLIYHLHPPTMVKALGKAHWVRPEAAFEENLKAMSFLGFNTEPDHDYIVSRKIFFFNNDMNIGVAAPSASMKDYFYKNADSDEILFIHKGHGELKTIYGTIDFGFGDYIVIPRGTVYQLKFSSEINRILFIESHDPVRIPKRYRNDNGQLLEHSPFCERDLKLPHSLETHDEKGEFMVMIKKNGLVYPYVYASHPFDAVGWDGYCYPFGFSIFDFEPITGRIHMPPPIHQQFESKNFVICSFVPRLYDYHPEAIPAPYHHSNIDSDEILYYVEGDFMSRNDIQPGQFTLHPAGIPHGPHPGAIERSIGKKETREIAVMIDPFKPVKVTYEAMNCEVKDYFKSWTKQTDLTY